MERIKILNIDIVNTGFREFLEHFTSGVMYTANVDHLVTLQHDREFYRAYKGAEYVTLDSQVVYLLCKVFGKSFKSKISGSDIFPAFCTHHKTDSDIAIFVLGGLGDVAVQVKNILNERTGREIVVDCCSPTFGFENDDAECRGIVERINKSGATVLAAGLGTPKQEKWIYRYKNDLPFVKIFMGVGATFDFIAGKQKRSPVLLQKIGLEWAYRLLHNPRRLFYRYLIRDVSFIYYFLLDRLGLYKDPFAQRD